MSINQIIIFSGLLFLNLLQVANATEQQANGQNGQNYNKVNGNVYNKKIGTMKLTNIKNEIKVIPENNISLKILNQINHLIIPKKLGFQKYFIVTKTKIFILKTIEQIKYIMSKKQKIILTI